MKTQVNFVLSVVTMLLSLTLVNCGSSGGSSGSTAAATPAVGASCGSNMLQSQYGCLTQCGTQSVIYNNSCVAITGVGYNNGAYNGTTGYGSTYGTGGNLAVCQQNCQSGTVAVTGANGQISCLPQGGCQPCYGTPDGQNCYIGNGAHQYYGY